MDFQSFVSFMNFSFSLFLNDNSPVAPRTSFTSFDKCKSPPWSINQLEDVTESNQDADIPYRWSDCICAGLSSKLAMKYQPEKFDMLNQVYERAFEFAASTDNDGVSMRVRPTGLNLS